MFREKDNSEIHIGLFFIFFNTVSNAIEIGQSVKVKTSDEFYYPRIWKTNNNEIRISSIVFKKNEIPELQTFDIDGKLVSVYKLPASYFSAYAKETAFFPEIKKYIFHVGDHYIILDPTNGQTKEFNSDGYIASDVIKSLTIRNGEYHLLVFATQDNMSIIQYWDLNGNKISTFKVPGAWRYRRHTHFIIDNKEYLTVAYDNKIITFDLITGTIKGADSHGCNHSNLASRTVAYGGKTLIVLPSQSECAEHELKPYDNINGIVLLDPFTFEMVKQFPADPIQCLGHCYNEVHVFKNLNQNKILFGNDAPTDPEIKQAYSIDIQGNKRELIPFPSWIGEFKDQVIFINVSRNFENNQGLYRVYTFYDLNGNKLNALNIDKYNWEPPQKAGDELFSIGFADFDRNRKRDQMVITRLY